MTRFFKDFVLPVSLLSGTIIGAGIFSLPYVFYQAGMGISFIFLGIFALLFIFIHLMYGDLLIKTGNRHRFAGLAREYFGKWGYWLSILMTVVEMFFVLTIYLILLEAFSKVILPNIQPMWGVIILWWICSMVVFVNSKKVAVFEFLAVIGIVAAIIFIVILGLPHFFEKTYDFASNNFTMWLLPFGPLLFAISGRQAIPAILEYFKKEESWIKKAKKTIIWGTIISAVIYGFFVLGMVGLSTNILTDSAIGLLSQNLSSFWLVLALAILGILSIVSSYFTIGSDLHNSLISDLKLPFVLSVLLISGVPLALYFISLGNFITLIEIAGGLFIGLEGITILFMWRKSLKREIGQKIFLRKLSPFVFYPILTVFVVSFLYVVFFKIL